jgi:hypothetical protein
VGHVAPGEAHNPHDSTGHPTRGWVAWVNQRGTECESGVEIVSLSHNEFYRVSQYKLVPTLALAFDEFWRFAL